MSKPSEKWKQIYKECAVMINECAVQQRSIDSIRDLYDKLAERYPTSEADNESRLPKYNTFRQKIRAHLELSSRSPDVKAALLRFAGAYSKMTIDSLADNVRISHSDLESDCCWFFIRLNRTITEDDNKFNSTQKHMYHLSHALKDKFSKEILYISFDRDTIVVLCKDEAAKKNVKEYISEINDDSIHLM